MGNRPHSLHPQRCRWLLPSLDRLATNDLRMTQELMVPTLGVRRETTPCFRGPNPFADKDSP